MERDASPPLHFYDELLEKLSGLGLYNLSIINIRSKTGFHGWRKPF
jgi:hypothetical protein